VIPIKQAAFNMNIHIVATKNPVTAGERDLADGFLS